MDNYSFSQQMLGKGRHVIIQRRYNTVTRETRYALIWESKRKSVITSIRKDLQKDGQRFVDGAFLITPNTVWE